MEKVTINSKEYLLGDINKYESGEIYKIGEELIFAEDCVFDFAIGTYLKKDSEEASFLVKGIVEFKDGDFVEGYFSPSLQNEEVSLTTENGYIKKKLVLNKSVLDNTDYVDTSSLLYKAYDSVTPHDLYEPFRISKDFKTKYPYGAGDVLNKYVSYFDNVKMRVSTGAKRIHSLLGGLSVGVEFETNKGLLSNRECYSNGLIPLRDGSIDGLEYVTIPISTEKGIQALINSILLLNEKATIDHKCALHYHYGNVPRTKEFIVAFWIVISLIQDDLYKYQLPYKRDNRGFKNKDYAKPLPNLLHKFDKILTGESLNKAYDVIIEYLAMGLYGKGKQPELKDINGHPADPDNRHKWNVKTRYTIANIIPLIFCNKKTIEFRHHDISLNSSIIINEMIINAAIINYVIKYEKEILANNIDINFYDVVSSTIESGRNIDVLFNFLDQKRGDVNRSFLKGDVFSDFTNNSYSHLTTYTKAETSIDNKFDIDFYKNNNIGGNRLRNVVNVNNIDRLFNRENAVTLRMFSNNVDLIDDNNNAIALSDDNKILNVRTTIGSPSHAYLTSVNKPTYSLIKINIANIVNITHAHLDADIRQTMINYLSLYLADINQYKTYLFSFLYSVDNDFRLFAKSIIKHVHISKAESIQRYDDILSFTEGQLLFDEVPDIRIIGINNISPILPNRLNVVSDILDYILEMYLVKLYPVPMQDLSEINKHLKDNFTALGLINEDSFSYYRRIKGDFIARNPLTNNKQVRCFYKNISTNIDFKGMLYNHTGIPLDVNIDKFILFNPNLI